MTRYQRTMLLIFIFSVGMMIVASIEENWGTLIGALLGLALAGTTFIFAKEEE